MFFKIRFWLKFSFFNLFLVALIGLFMRYKIGFEFPYFNQNYLQHSHSHFAFSGWVSHTLMVLMIGFLEKQNSNTASGINFNSYNKILSFNLISAYGMLICFAFQGYGIYSIFFSSLSIFISYIFGYRYLKDLKHINKKNLSVNWFKSAIFFNVISSFGTFVLAFMIATKNIHQELYLSSIYYYLHFQYNGWFFFACMGLFFSFVNLKPSQKSPFNKIFYLFFSSCILAYFLSILWIELPRWLYIITVIAACIQVYALVKLLSFLFKMKLKIFEIISPFLRYILLFVCLALNLKLLLQLGSTIPFLSGLAFGFRPIVIAYLHLVLLAIVTLFLFLYIYMSQIFEFNKQTKFGIVIFTTGVFLNEIMLVIQGVASYSNRTVYFVNELLFVAAIILVIGIGLMLKFSNIHQVFKKVIPD